MVCTSSESIFASTESKENNPKIQGHRIRCYFDVKTEIPGCCAYDVDGASEISDFPYFTMILQSALALQARTDYSITKLTMGVTTMNVCIL